MINHWWISLLFLFWHFWTPSDVSTIWCLAMSWYQSGLPESLFTLACTQIWIKSSVKPPPSDHRMALHLQSEEQHREKILNRYLYIHVHRSISHNIQRVEAHRVCINGCIYKMRHTHTMEYHPALKRNEIPTPATTRMNLKHTLSEISQSRKDRQCKWFHLHEGSRGVKFRNTMVVTGSGGERSAELSVINNTARGMGRYCLMGISLSSAR